MSLLILIADDDRDDRELLAETIFELHDQAKIIQVGDGIALLAILSDVAAARPDIIFLDINMPLLGGIETLKRIRNLPTNSTVPVIMFSTSSNSKEIEDCLKFGAHKFITKPSSFVELLREVKNSLCFIEN